MPLKQPVVTGVVEAQGGEDSAVHELTFFADQLNLAVLPLVITGCATDNVIEGCATHVPSGDKVEP